MARYVFLKKRDETNLFDRTDVKLAVETDSLPDLLEAFGEYLRGCGFCFDGEIEIVSNDDDTAVPDDAE